jgi:hypothetical protein
MMKKLILASVMFFLMSGVALATDEGEPVWLFSIDRAVVTGDSDYGVIDSAKPEISITGDVQLFSNRFNLVGEFCSEYMPECSKFNLSYTLDHVSDNGKVVYITDQHGTQTVLQLMVLDISSTASPNLIFSIVRNEEGAVILVEATHTGDVNSNDL